jgi:UDP-glucose 4-epimerase
LEGGVKVLVTGSAGFIGANLMRLLGARGVPFDRHLGQDVMSAEIEEEVAQVDAVVHLAAATGVEESVRNPTESLDNVDGVLSVLEACRRSGVPVALASTAGALAGLPRSPYAASKLAAEAYCHAYRESYGVMTTVLRLGNVYGPYSAHKRSFIAALCRAARDGAPFELYGSGLQRRDFVFVGDVCQGILAALEARVPGTFNLASGRLKRLDTVMAMVEEISGRRVIQVWKEQRQGEADPTIGIDISAATDAFGYRPSTPLADGLRQTWDWFAAQPAWTF